MDEHIQTDHLDPLILALFAAGQLRDGETERLEKHLSRAAGRTSPFPTGTVWQRIDAHARYRNRPLASIRSDVPAALAAAVDRMLAEVSVATPADACGCVDARNLSIKILR